MPPIDDTLLADSLMRIAGMNDAKDPQQPLDDGSRFAFYGCYALGSSRFTLQGRALLRHLLFWET